MGEEKPGPISGRHDGSTILCTGKLAEITCCRLIDYTSQIIQRAGIGTAKLPFDEPKTGIRRELGVASTVQFSFPLRHRFHFAQQPSLQFLLTVEHYVGSLLYCCFNIVEESNIICGGGRYLRPLRGKRSI